MNILLIIIPGGDKIIYYNTFMGIKLQFATDN